MSAFPAALVLISSLAITAVVAFPADVPKNRRGLPIPPESPHKPILNKDYNSRKIASRVESWTPNDKQNVWELSGLFEGDIMLYPTASSDVAKNGLINENFRWPGGIVPIYIDDEDFNEGDIKLIKEGIKEYHEKTCLRFRAYNESDKDYVTIKGGWTGCWSSVGRQGKGQVLNLQTIGCMRHGTIVHELLHAVGFYHQQSATDRDDYVNIHWNNIKSGREHNFNKYDKNVISDYGVGYDYGSVMHYSDHAFSKNGEATITPLEDGAKIGQREGMSDKDIAKLQIMYKEECGGRKPMSTPNDDIEDILEDSVAWLTD